MSKKSFSQQMQEAYVQSQNNGIAINKSTKEHRDHINRNIDLGRNLTLNHLNENDRGFYIPKSEQYRKGLLDGDFIRKSHITEQDDLTDEEKKRLDREIAQQNQKYEDELRRRSGSQFTGIDTGSDRYTGRENEAEVRSTINTSDKIGFDPTAPGAQDAIRRAQVQDQLGRRPRSTGTRQDSSTGGVVLGRGNPEFDKSMREYEQERKTAEMLKFGYQPADDLGGGPPDLRGYEARQREFDAETARQKEELKYQQDLERSTLMPANQPGTREQRAARFANRRALSDKQAQQNRMFRTQQQRARDIFMDRGSDFEGGQFPNLASSDLIARVRATPTGGGSTTTTDTVSTTKTGDVSTTKTGGGGQGNEYNYNTQGFVGPRLNDLRGEREDLQLFGVDLPAETGGPKGPKSSEVMGNLGPATVPPLIRDIFSPSAGPDRVATDFEARERMRQMGAGVLSAEELAAKDQEAARQRAERNRAQGDLTDAEYQFQQRAMGIQRGRMVNPPSGGESRGRRYPDDFPSTDPPSGGEVSAQRLDPPAGMGVSPAGVDPNSGSAIQFPVTGASRFGQESDVGQRTPAEDMDSHVRDMERIRSEIPFYNPIDAMLGRPTGLMSPEQAELRRRSREAQERARGDR